MRQLRYFSSAILAVVFISCSLFYISCKNKCGGTTCQNGGSCSNNKCVCPTGYSGNSCEHGWADAAIGTYTCTRSSCTPAVAGVNNWQSSITKASTNGGYTVNISNFNNSNTTVEATVDSAISNIQRVTIGAAGGTGTNASGSLTIVSGVTTINLHFTTYSGGIAGSSCEMSMRKL